MGKFTFAVRPEQGPTSPASSMGCIETKGLVLAPQPGLEPGTLRLTAECSTIELLRSNDVSPLKQTLQTSVKLPYVIAGGAAGENPLHTGQTPPLLLLRRRRGRRRLARLALPAWLEFLELLRCQDPA